MAKVNDWWLNSLQGVLPTRQIMIDPPPESNLARLERVRAMSTVDRMEEAQQWIDEQRQKELEKWQKELEWRAMPWLDRKPGDTIKYDLLSPEAKPATPKVPEVQVAPPQPRRKIRFD
jgi:hypothetical protein